MTRCYSEKTQINKIKDEIGNITTITIEIQRVIDNILKSYIQRRWKIQKKQINF
jgi:hypothetical protein